MASNNVAQFAAELKMPAGVLLEQLQAAGVTKANEDDDLSETDKSRLLEHLRKSHGSADADKRKITLTRRHTSEIKQSDSTGKARTIQVEVRKKRVFVKRDESGVEQVVEGANHIEDDVEVDEAELQRRDEEARHAAELLEKEALELKERQERFEREEAERLAREEAAEAERRRAEEEEAKRAAARAEAAEMSRAAAAARQEPSTESKTDKAAAEPAKVEPPSAPFNAKPRRRRKTPRALRLKRLAPNTTRSRNVAQRLKPKHVRSAK
jgi:translation initiation factor IF-2